MKEKVKKIIKDKTFSMYSDSFYELVSNEIDNLYLSNSGVGYVYLISNGNSGVYKIGMSKDLLKRLASYQTVFENGVILHAYLKCEGYDKLEKKLHFQFKDKKVKGEFFKLEVSDLISLQDYNFSFTMQEYKSGCNSITNMISNTSDAYRDTSMESHRLFNMPLGERIYNSYLHGVYTPEMSKKAIRMDCVLFAKKMGYDVIQSVDAKGRFIIFKKPKTIK